jgi:hypothetical protein
MKRIVIMVFALCLAFAVVGYAEPFPEDQVQKVMGLKADAEATKDMTASIERLPIVNSEEEIPRWHREGATKDTTASIERFPIVNSEEEIPLWHREGAKKDMATSIERFPIVNSEEEIPRWNREGEIPHWHPGWISQKSM